MSVKHYIGRAQAAAGEASIRLQELTDKKESVTEAEVEEAQAWLEEAIEECATAIAQLERDEEES